MFMCFKVAIMYKQPGNEEFAKTGGEGNQTKLHWVGSILLCNHLRYQVNRCCLP